MIILHIVLYFGSHRHDSRWQTVPRSQSWTQTSAELALADASSA